MSAGVAIALPHALPVARQDCHVTELFDRLQQLAMDTRAANGDIHRLVNQGFLGRFVSSVTGETATTFARAQNLQTQLQEAQIALVLLNLHLTDQVRQQQTALTRQQEILLNANTRIEAHQQDIQASAEQIKAQNETILQLLELSAEQEARIREVVQTADYVTRVERRHDERLSELSEQLRALEKKCGEGIEGVRTNIQSAVQVEATAREAAARTLEQRLAADIALLDQAVARGNTMLSAHAETLLDLQKTTESNRVVLIKTRDETALSFGKAMRTSVAGVFLALAALVLMTLIR
jgi:chromosome segregation ATPase